MKDFKFLSHNDSKDSLNGPMGENGVSGITIPQSIVKSMIDEDYEPMNNPDVVDHMQGFILNVYLFGIVITSLVNLLTYAGF
jgi:hypothetical protein